MSSSLQPYGLQHARLPCLSPSHGVCSNSCPLSWWCPGGLVAKLCSTLVIPWPTRLLCPWDFPGRNTRVVCHFLLQGIFLIQGLTPGFPALQEDSLPSEQPGDDTLEKCKFKFLAHFWIDSFAFYKFPLYSGSQSPIRHMICKFLLFCELPFYSVDSVFWGIKFKNSCNT